MTLTELAKEVASKMELVPSVDVPIILAALEKVKDDSYEAGRICGLLRAKELNVDKISGGFYSIEFGKHLDKELNRTGGENE